MALKIRKAKSVDAKGIYNLLILAKSVSKKVKIKEALKDVKYNIKNRNTYVALVDNKIVVGYTSFISIADFKYKNLIRNPKRNSAMAVGLVVHPKFRKKGIATALKKYAFKQASKEHSYMYTTVSKNNLASIKLQRNLGTFPLYTIKLPNGKREILFIKKL